MAECCARPLWTSCFFLAWLLALPGAYFTHLALFDLIPQLKAVPENIVKGFDETFGFAYLEKDSETVESAAVDALLKCQVVAETVCPSGNYPGFTTSKTSNTTDEQAEIVASFESSLSIVNKVANDKYFGVEELRPTAESLNNITKKLRELNSTMECVVSTPLFCNIYNSAAGIVEGMSSVNEAIDAFKSSPIVEKWEEYDQYLILLHASPYIMVVALACFTFFWMKGGVCCCCKGGTFCGSLALIPFALCWLVSLVGYGIVCATGFTMKYGKDYIEISALNGKPTLQQTIDHMKMEYPEFWNVVFAGMELGLGQLLIASYFFVVAGLIIFFHSVGVCCCCPYRERSDKEKPQSNHGGSWAYAA